LDLQLLSGVIWNGGIAEGVAVIVQGENGTALVFRGSFVYYLLPATASG